MLVDKNGREITAGCKVLWDDTLCDIDWVGESHRKEVQELCAKHMEVVDIDIEGECNLRLECKRTIQSSPIKEWLKKELSLWINCTQVLNSGLSCWRCN